MANPDEKSPLKLGINGLGRIGKLSLWHHAARNFFSEIVVNLGREAGRGLEDVADYIERDSTYGSLGQYLYGHKAGRVIENLNEEHGTLKVNGTPVTILRQDAQPQRHSLEIPRRAGGGRCHREVLRSCGPAGRKERLPSGTPAGRRGEGDRLGAFQN